MKIVSYLVMKNCYEIIDSASPPFRLKLTETMHIIRKNPWLNKQLKHGNISLSVTSTFIFMFYFHFPLSFPFIPSSVLISC